MPSKRINVIAVPLYKRTWLFHSWSDAELQQQDLDWNSTKSLQDKLSSALKSWGLQFDSNVKTQWRELQVAKEGTFRAWLYQLGQTVLSREDPIETFLKNVPNDVTRLQLLYPASSSEAGVRRRIRLLALERSTMHRRKIVGWGLITLPQLPLILTPFPNVTLYFSVYRFLSHFQALRGANALVSALGREDAIQLQKMYRLASSGRPKSGTHWSPGIFSWKRGKESKQLQSVQEECRRQLTQREGLGQAAIVLFEPSPLLDSITQPQERWHTPLGDDAISVLSKEFHLDGLLEHYARAKNRGFQK